MTVVLLLLTVFVCSTHGFSTEVWMTNLTEPFNMKCPHGETLSRVTSNYNNTMHDRRWDFGCHLIGAESICKTHDLGNTLTKVITFSCDTKMAITGIESVYDATVNDRRFNFTCCIVPFIKKRYCKKIPIAAEYGDYINLKLSYNEVISAVYSRYKKSKRDRKWDMTVCTLR